MQEPNVGVAVAGLGFVGAQAHVPGVRKVPGAELVAVIDVIEDLAKDIANKYKVPFYTDFSKALKDPKIDAIIVSVPTPFHYRLASAAIASGKHVLCEMPMTPTTAESEKLSDQAEQAGVILMPDLNFRFTPNYVKAKELIDQDAIGTPIAVTFSEYIAAKDLEAQWPAGSWAWDAEKSGGYPDASLSVWSIDLIRWLIGEIEDVEWMCHYAPLRGFGQFTGYNTVGIIRCSNGAVGNLHYSATVFPGEGTSRLEVFGNNTQAIRAVWNNSITLTGASTEQQTWTYKGTGTKAWGHRQIDAYFVDCILHGKTPSITVDDAIKTQIIAHKMLNK